MHSERIAAVDAGITGQTTGHPMARRPPAVVFKADDRLSDRACAHDVRTADGREIPADSGFIAHNNHTYPNLPRPRRELGVSTRDAEMSISVRGEGHGQQHAGGRRAEGRIAARTNPARAAYPQMRTEVTRWHRHGRRVLDSPDAGEVTLGGLPAVDGSSRCFVEHTAVPLAAPAWSVDQQTSSRHPARSRFAFPPSIRRHTARPAGDRP